MISKYDGICHGCARPYAKGEDIYWAKEDGGWHWLCRESQPASTETERIADELGFINAAGLPADGLLRAMRSSDRKFAAGRDSAAPLPRQESTLFGEE